MSFNCRSLFHSPTAVFLTGLLLGLMWSSPAATAAPTISNVSVRALTIGAPQVLVVDGADLLPDPKLILSVPLAKQAIQAGATANRVTFELQVADVASPGIYPVRVASGKGVSNSTFIAIDRLPNFALAADTTTLPVSLLGTLTGDGRVRTTIVGKKGQTLVAEVECQRLASSFRPVVRLIDSRGVQLAWGAPVPALGGDSRLIATLPADGNYVVEVQDILFRAAGPGFFRLKLGEFHFADAAFPNGVMAGQLGSLEFRRTNLAAGARFEFDARALHVPGEYAATLPSVGGVGPVSGLAPRVFVSEVVQVVEPLEPATLPRTVPAAPLAIHGFLAKHGEEDRYTIPVTPGAKLQFEVQAQRFGSPLDGVLSILGPAGNALASNDDRPGTSDPAVDVTIAADVNQVIAVVRDLEGRGGAEFTYCLVVRDLNRPEFTLTLDADRINIPAGGTRLVTLPVTRQGDTGAIQLEIPGLPPGVQVAGQAIAPHHGVGLISLSAPAGTVPAAALSSLVGKSANGQPPVIRAAQLAENAANRIQPWLRRELAVAVAEADPLAVTWLPVAPDEKLMVGAKLPVKVQVTRAAGVMGQVRVRLVTSQIIPKKTVKQDNKDVQVDDLDRALRLESDFVVSPDLSEGKNAILVPADLPLGTWNVALVAELLGADGKAVVTSAYTPVRTLTAAK